jgi:predicted MPP superfamily phosphohydrolase
LQRLITHVQKIQPDLILLPGDIIDDDPHVFFKKEMDSMMKQLKAPLGTYGILGNHEYYGGKIPQFVERMKEINIPILMDEVLNIGDSLYLIGRKDKTDKNRDSFFDLASETDRSLPIIAMDHQPLSLKEAEQAGVDLLLCGHTHRGQMAPNHLITKRLFEIDWGYKQNNQLHTIVSSGFGFWGPPLRIGSRSEIIQIDISFTK